MADIADGGNIIRYGEVIGTAKGAIKRGDWVNEDNVVMGKAPPLDQLEMATRLPPRSEPLTGYTFEGYRNADGSVGTKNILAITTSVQCVAGMMEFAVKRIKAELLPKYPNVDDVVALTHAYGCGVAINAPAAPRCRSAPCRTWPSIPISAAKCWWSAWAARSCSRNACCRKTAERRRLVRLRLQDEAFVGFGAMIAGIMDTAEDASAKC